MVAPGDSTPYRLLGVARAGAWLAGVAIPADWQCTTGEDM